MFSGPCFGKQNRRCGMNREPARKVPYAFLIDTIKGVSPLKQQDGGHGSRKPLRSV